MSDRTARWSSPVVATVLAVVTTALVLAVGAPGRAPVAAADPTNQSPAPPEATADVGQTIWMRDCAVCHGVRGEGSYRAPAVTSAGAASIDFMVRTGRMPPPHPNGVDETLASDPARRDIPRAAPAYSDGEIRSLVAFTDQFVDGPPVPPPPDLSGADVVRGGELYRLHCSACHQMAGSGGALAYGTTAPSLHDSTPTEVIEAMRTGPGSMPVFPASTISDAEARDLTAYVRYLDQPRDRGGVDLWHLGPVPEGLAAWVLGIAAIVAICRWLGQRDRISTD